MGCIGNQLPNGGVEKDPGVETSLTALDQRKAEGLPSVVGISLLATERNFLVQAPIEQGSVAGLQEGSESPLPPAFCLFKALTASREITGRIDEEASL
jgi:hypothetical protein